jgi:hypothetical protein
MANEHDKLRKTLAELNAQIEELRARDPEVAEKLAATIADAETALIGRAQPRDDEEAETLVERLSDAVLEYEASHPSLAGNLGAILHALGNIGI